MKSQIKKRSAQFDKKLAAHTLAGAAVLAPGVAKADIIHFDNVNTTVDQPGSYVFSLPATGGAQLNITAAQVAGFSGNPTNQVSASATNGAQVLLVGPGPNNNVESLAFGDLIDPSTGNWGNGGKMVGYDTVTPSFSGGDWSATGGTGYLGFYFPAAGGNFAGWAEIATTANASGSSFTLRSYAYEDEANVALRAGDIGAVPEPSTMALLAVGGAGLIALRRRRSKNA